MDTKDKMNFFDDYTKVVKKVFVVVASIVLTFFLLDFDGIICYTIF